MDKRFKLVTKGINRRKFFVQKKKLTVNNNVVINKLREFYIKTFLLDKD